MKLIDAGKLKEEILYEFGEMLLEIESYDRDGSLLVEQAMKRIEQVIDEQPGAYSVEKVLNALEKEIKPIAGLYTADTPMMERAGYKMEYNKAIKKSIEIVNKGWKL